MKILLIGKYPPMQGGISTKTYWLVEELKKRGFDYGIVTIENADYVIKEYKSNSSKCSIIKSKKIPWHIPESELLGERIFAKVIRMADTFKPDLIETNYLWPFCLQAVMVATVLKKPLIIRHAGSDIQKFHTDPEFKNIIKDYLDRATAVITNSTAQTLIESLCDDSEKVHCLKRYIPNPEIFRAESKEKTFGILFAGKINYHWKLKGLTFLLDLIKQQGLRSLFVIGGKYKNKILERIEQTKTSDYIEIRDFVSPEMMPSIYNSCKSVWCWEEQGGVEDFSNIIWESLFCNIPCIIKAISGIPN